MKKFICHHPIFAATVSFIAGIFVGAIYLNYRHTIEGWKLSFPEGIIKNWDSPAQNLGEVLGKRTRGKITWQWPIKPLKKGSTKAEYQTIWQHHLVNPDLTYDQMAEYFDVDRKKIERALRAGRMGRLK
jgi:hypothetical protein